MIVFLSKISERMRKRFPAVIKNAAAVTFLGAGVVLSAQLAQAQTAVSSPYVTRKDIQVAVRAFSFVYGMPEGAIQIEVVYNPNNAASMTEARELRSIIGSGRVFAGREVTEKMVTVAQMSTTGSRFAYVTHGLEREYPALVAEAQSHKMLTFSTDFKCVDSQSCVMGVESAPSVNIEISRTAALATGVQFSPALELMVREVQ